MKSSNIGGQAVLEGIMMKNEEEYAVAVRKPDGEIEVKVDTYEGVAKKLGEIKKIPFIRGIFSFVDSLVLGSTLMYSASFWEDEEEPEKALTEAELRKQEKQEKLMMGGTIAFSIVFAVAIFMVLPYVLTTFLKRFDLSAGMFAVCEGIIKILIFFGYILMISQMKDIKRVFMYHGSEHKCINCIEHGLELTVENVKKSSRLHKRCGTSFLLFVMIVSIILHFFVRFDSGVWNVIARILLVPVIAGISYELIKWAGNSENKIIGTLSIPGLMLQKITTKEPEDDMIEVAIRAVEAVFDWEAYREENFGEAVHDV